RDPPPWPAAPGPAPARVSCSEAGGQGDTTGGDQRPLPFRLQVGRLPWPVLGPARHEGGHEPLPLRRPEVVVVGGDQHHLLGREPQQRDRGAVYLGAWLVAARVLRGDHAVPG